MKFIKNIKLKSVKTISLIILLCFTLFSGTIVTYQYLVEEIKTTNNANKTLVSNDCYDEILLYYNSLKTQATLESQKISDSIRNEIIDKYNLDSLKNELDYSVYSEKLMNIIQEHVQDKYLNNVKTHNNSVIVADYNGIIIDYNYSITDSKIRRTWEEEKSNQSNIPLYLNSVKKILNQTNEQFIVQEENKSSNNSEFTIDNFKDLYYNEGIEGFKNLTFLVPTYIYDHEDIFGDSDIVDGKKIKNHKLIVIQKFNLYDQISELNYSVIKKNSINEITNNGNLILTRLYIFGIIVLSAVMGLIIVLCLMYNKVMSELRKEHQIDNNKAVI